MSDPTTSGSANVGDTTYSWLSTAIGDVLYATRASGWRERLLIGPQVPRVFATLAQHSTSDPLEQLRHEQRTLEQARLEEAAREDRTRQETEHRELQQALDAGVIAPETYVRHLADQAARRATPPPSLQDRLADHRILARLEQDLQIGRVGQILDAAGSDRSPGADDAVLIDLEAAWHGVPRRAVAQTTPPWTARPHGHLPAATLARQLSWLKQSLPNLIGQAESAEAEAAALTADAEHGRGPTARALRQDIQAGRDAAEAAREATTGFQSANAHIRRSLALHQAADEAERRAHASPTHLFLRGTTSAAQRHDARELRAQAVLARSTADEAIAAATTALTRARTLRPTAPRLLRNPTAADQLRGAVERDLQDADGPAADLRSAAARLRTKATTYQDHLEQLTAEAKTRSELDPRQRIAEDLERETQHRQRHGAGAPARTGRPAERHPRAGRHPNPPTTGPSPT
ncbi:hypothetical protein [Kitasatospora herbaricolor]|uniref:Uncharacterized protein n=1 Tax=Kitasatospora herbaricolor TaxID=68217 RepID=A0ABZ1W0K8_9ACTN|nr:hypothetical protein [Kitasatospora herbaricolor]